MNDPAPTTRLLDAAIRALRLRGGEVRLFAEAENCVRLRDGGEECGTDRDAGTGELTDPLSLPFVVEVQGLPNLLHELAHVVLLGRLAKDHATDYSRIPFDAASDHGRRLLFEELACCSTSCAWHPGGEAEAEAWFEEQVGIQGCFFGVEGEPARFIAAVDATVTSHLGELAAVERRARDGLEAALREADAPPEIARPRRAYSVAAAWRRLAQRLLKGPRCATHPAVRPPPPLAND